MSRREKHESKNNKLLIAILLILIAVVLTIGSLVAYFSDIVIGTGSVTAGTLDITGTYQFYVNGSSTAVASVANFNPGDVVAIKATIANEGNKSAWLRNVISFTMDTGIASYIKLYEGEVTLSQIQGGSLTALTLTDGVYTSTDKIIDGTGTAAETETGSVGTSTNVAYTVYFDTAALNAAQGKTVSFTAKTQALQYKNNPGPNWSGSDVVTEAFSLPTP